MNYREIGRLDRIKDLLLGRRFCANRTVAISAVKMEKPKIRMLVNYTGERPLAQRSNP